MSAIKEQLHDKIEEGQRGLHKIGWLNMPGYRPETWNPVIGCTKVSPGCDNCYAEKAAFVRSFNSNTPQYKKVVVGHPLDPRYRQWNGFTELVYSAIQRPFEWKSPRMVFVCSMSDLFHESTSFETINAVFSVMADCNHHLFIVLTKRPERMRDFYQWKRNTMMGIPWQPSANVWMGVTAENQEQANKRIPVLLSVPAAKRFVSVEPMLGPIYFSYEKPAEGCTGIKENWLTGEYIIEDEEGIGRHKKDSIDWVICGGESGPKARPMHPDWVRSLRNQCQSANTPFFFKGWGTWRPLTTTKLIEKLPFGDYDVEFKRGFVKKDKHMIGNCIDGIYHEEWPKVEG